MNVYERIPDEVEEIAAEVIDACFKVHDALGPGLLESVYEVCLAYELESRGIEVQTQVHVPVVYRDVELDAALKLDMLVEDCIVVELKATDMMIPVYEAQLLTYLKLTGKRLGFLVNFNVPLIKNGIKRMVL